MVKITNPLFQTDSDQAAVIAASGDDDMQRTIIEALNELSSEERQAGHLIGELRNKDNALAFLSGAFVLSPYLRDCALIKPQNLVQVLGNSFDMAAGSITGNAGVLWNTAGSQAELMAGLREAKRQMALCLGLADLGGWMNGAQITRHLSLFADAVLSAAVNHLLKAQHEAGRLVLADLENPSHGSGLIVLGMGKYGAYELNYSSDIDIILFFDDESPVLSACDDPASLFARLAKQLSRLLQERTGDGYVFRVDLRLRPDPGSTPLAIPVETAMNYYAAYGQNWERAAFIKARAVAGDFAAGERFLRELAPFVWRKYLDFAAIQDVHSIKRQIHAHKGHGEIAIKGHNIKLGRGGIREIEFFVQTQQLIAGGRREQLRVRGTVEGLEKLRDDGWISAEAAERLSVAYWFLRKVEHRIQMVADEQSHVLPEDDEGLCRIAAMAGFKDVDAFTGALVATMREVEHFYAELFEQAPQLTGQGGNLVFTGEDEDPQTVETLSRLGFQRPSQVISSIKAWHYGRYPAVRSSQAREMLTEITPQLLEDFSTTGNPDQAFVGFDRFLQGLPAGIQFFGILKANPNLTRLLTLLLDAAPRLADIITRKPHIFDGLIDPTFSADIPGPEELKERLSAVLARSRGYEEKLDQARLFAAEQRFLIGVRLINRTISPRRAGEAYTILAETLINGIFDEVLGEFKLRHGEIPGGEIAILGMGRLGSRDLTAGSDLDLIFLYRHDEAAEQSDGEKPLYAQQYYTRLVQRLITAMSAPMAEGRIFELDFRLRPSGNAGPLATHFDAFCRYQAKEAWVWERQALVRARPVAGDAGLAEALRAKLAELRKVRGDATRITREIAEMRQTLDEEKPPENTFDAKRAPGGLIDIEFIAQWLALTGNLTEGLPQNPTSTIELIDHADPAIIDSDAVNTLKAAYGLYNTVLQIQRVCLRGGFDPQEEGLSGFKSLLCEQTGHPALSALEQELEAVQGSVRDVFRRCVG
ncbi:bifunctional [glutamine synthetase] adenylyltransferase/[glutamine synthetase]-adenylyl-L-tyrosine phosphorylase [Salaquimonas pukyongi]|uniref:bifunctional [glutamine synthetase] adenylyltransferase/[glutamine synthetase]-adenylyl-L-tyrosine phosphorylase n=1 Tax=Salaquimonas pukyongi TaxID=2712698 RepID=UPI00096B8107|nr:bifunctional [glutamine synthetase] adenylyltransferase/[glutamine synthetase]-adenylyl-L-tyrosine phosphorylase [Salaquimonas pukyongi]